MHLVIGTVFWVILVTILVGITGFVVDRSTRRQEAGKNDPKE